MDKCSGIFFTVHDYGKWIIFEEGKLSGKGQLGVEVEMGRFIRQRRVCKDCGFTQLNQESATT